MCPGRKRSPVSPESAFGNVLRELRERRELSQEQLALQSGLVRPHVGMLERGERSPTLTTLFRLAQALRVEPGEMIRLVQEQVQTTEPQPPR